MVTIAGKHKQKLGRWGRGGGVHELPLLHCMSGVYSFSILESRNVRSYYYEFRTLNRHAQTAVIVCVCVCVIMCVYVCVCTRRRNGGRDMCFSQAATYSRRFCVFVSSDVRMRVGCVS